jgi:hypothetical protein
MSRIWVAHQAHTTNVPIPSPLRPSLFHRVFNTLADCLGVSALAEMANDLGLDRFGLVADATRVDTPQTVIETSEPVRVCGRTG